ncbi:MAG: efflux RND transporter periplasmic adaptor subunit [Gemmataceae bacterium]|nr:efflux RND transporter periplasmic adaptor subunit [Gemmataceae bacterium]
MKRAILGIGAVVLVGVAGAAGYLWHVNHQAARLRLPGTVEIQEVRLSSRVGGRIEAVLTQEGAIVEPGQPLVHLEMPELRAQRDQYQARLQAAQATLLKAQRGARPQEKESALAAADAAKARYDRMTAGYRAEEKDEARHEVAALKAELTFAQQEMERHRRLRTSTSLSELESATSAAAKLDAKVRQAQARLDLYESGHRAEDKAEAKAEWISRRAQAELLQAGTREEEIAEADARVAELYGKLRELDAQLAEAVVRAPERAVVEVVAVRKGDVVAANQPVVRVLRADDLWVKAYVSEVDLGKVSVGQTVELTIDSFPTKRFQGVVAHIVSTSEFTPRNIQSLDERRHQVFAIKVRVDDPQGIFKSGMAADVWLQVTAP